MSQGLEEPVYSKKEKQQAKLKEFREYLVDKEVVLAIVKYILSIKNSKDLPENPLQALTDYFGTYKDQSEWEVFDNLTKNVNDTKDENQRLEQEIISIKQQIEQAKIDKIRREEEEKQRELEEQNNKKGAKKPPAKK
ncbi:hypothetical protein ABPG72_002615 [Tetrahymena utriculariae]